MSTTTGTPICRIPLSGQILDRCSPWKRSVEREQLLYKLVKVAEFLKAVRISRTCLFEKNHSPVMMFSTLVPSPMCSLYIVRAPPESGRSLGVQHLSRVLASLCFASIALSDGISCTALHAPSAAQCPGGHASQGGCCIHSGTLTERYTFSCMVSTVRLSIIICIARSPALVPSCY